MMRRLAPALFVLTTIVGFMVGFTVRPRTGPVAAEPRGGVAPAEPISASARATSPGAVNFADVAARLNPAVVNVEAASRSRSFCHQDRLATGEQTFGCAAIEADVVGPRFALAIFG